jgi:hypothetical protein
MDPMPPALSESGDRVADATTCAWAIPAQAHSTQQIKTAALFFMGTALSNSGEALNSRGFVLKSSSLV